MSPLGVRSYTAEQVGVLLGLTAHAVRKRAHAGLLPSEAGDPGRRPRYYFPSEEIDRLVGGVTKSVEPGGSPSNAEVWTELATLHAADLDSAHSRITELETHLQQRDARLEELESEIRSLRDMVTALIEAHRGASEALRLLDKVRRTT